MKDLLNVIDLFKERKWKEIADNYHDHPERSKLLWVFPSEENFVFLKDCLEELKCDKVLSIGCGSGLLEWMITEATGIPVSGVEIDGAWWHCKYAPPTFIPLTFTSQKLDDHIINILRQPRTALLFCYFNNRAAFEQYLKHYTGNTLIIIGPGYGKGIHTDPKPFDDVSEEWKLHGFREVRNSQDFIAVYYKINSHSSITD